MPKPPADGIEAEADTSASPHSQEALGPLPNCKTCERLLRGPGAACVWAAIPGNLDRMLARVCKRPAVACERCLHPIVRAPHPATGQPWEWEADLSRPARLGRSHAEACPGLEKSRCKGCGQVIVWRLWKRKDGTEKRHPFNLDGTSHFATCPQAERFRKQEQKETP